MRRHCSPGNSPVFHRLWHSHSELSVFLCSRTHRSCTTRCLGVSVLISTAFGGEVVGPSHSNWVFVRVSGQEINTPIIIGSVYLPVGIASRLVKRQLAVDLGRLTAEYPDTPLILMGNFNLDLPQLQRLTTDWPGIYQVAKNEGDLSTVRRTGGRCVDHICMRTSAACSSALPRSKVLQDWDISDHNPVVNKIPAMKRTQQRVPARTAERSKNSKRIQVPTNGAEMETIASHNRWESLAPDADAADKVLDRDAALAKLNDKASTLKQVCHEIAAEMELHNLVMPSGPSIVPTKLRRSIKRRGARFSLF